MIRNKTARRIASEWHSGQWTNLYAFSSSGKLLTTKQGAIQEIDDCLKDETRKSLRSELEGLREYVNQTFPDYPDGPFYADLDEASALFCVFHCDTGKAHASCAGMPEAEQIAKDMNEEYLRKYETK